MAPAAYQDLRAQDIPDAHPSADVEISVVAGQAQGSASEGMLTSPMRSKVGCEYVRSSGLFGCVSLT